MLPQPQAGAVLDRFHSWTWFRDSEREGPGVFAFRTTTYPKDGGWMTAASIGATVVRLLFPSPNPAQDRTFALALHRQKEAQKFRYTATLTTKIGRERGSCVCLEVAAEPNGDDSQWASAGEDPQNHEPVRKLVAAIAGDLGAVISIVPEHSA